MRRPICTLILVAGGAFALSGTGVLTADVVDVSQPWGFAIENGDVNGDQERDISDGVYTLGHLFLGGPAPVLLAHCGVEGPAVANGDVNGDGGVDVSDAVRLLDWLFADGPAPAPACGSGDGGGGGNVPRIAPPNSKAFGKTLGEWLETYWRWNFATAADPAQSMVGKVKLLPIPAATLISGDGTPDNPALLQGFIEVTLSAGTPFVIPQFAWIAERYDPALGIPDDPAFPDGPLLAGVSPNMSLDGVVLVSDANETEYYIPATPFDPIVVYPAPSSYGSVAAISFQGTGIVSPPLSVGEHILTLYEPYIIRDLLGFSFGVIYDNTWKIIVTP